MGLKNTLDSHPFLRGILRSKLCIVGLRGKKSRSVPDSRQSIDDNKTVFYPLTLGEPKRFKTVGKNPDTGRKKTLHIYAPDQTLAEIFASRSDLQPPYTIEPEPLPQPEPATERQIAYAQKLCIQIPAAATKEDLSAILTRVENNDMQQADLRLAQYLQDRVGEISPYESKYTLIWSALRRMKPAEQCAFYAYAVWCKLNGYALEELRTSPDADLFWTIGQSLTADEKLLRSVQDRPGSDFYNPNANTSAFKAVKTKLSE